VTAGTTPVSRPEPTIRARAIPAVDVATVIAPVPSASATEIDFVVALPPVRSAVEPSATYSVPPETFGDTSETVPDRVSPVSSK